MKVWRMVALTAALVLSFVLPGSTGTARADSNPWGTAAPMPTARMGLAAASLDSSIYAIGGSNSSGYLTTVDAYAPATNTWMSRAPLSSARSGLAAVALNGHIYVFGGSNATSQLATVESYSPATNTWTSLAAMPTARTGAAAVAGLDGRIYVIGGYSSSKGYLNTVEIYSPLTNTWTTGSPMPTGRAWLAAALSADGRIFALGGTNGASPLATVQAYAVGTGIWSTLAPMPTGRYGLAAVAGSDHNIYVVGGRTSTSAVATVEGYTPASNSWFTANPIRVPREYLGAATWQDGRLYVIGGRTPAGTIASTVEVCLLPGVFNPAPPAPLQVVATPGNSQVTLTWIAPPLAPGNPAIDHYTIDVSQGTTHVVYAHITGSPFTVTGLTNGTAYQFNIASVDVLGNASPAVKVAATPFRPTTVPAAPTNVWAGTINSNVHVTWTAPDNGGSPITAYLVSVYAGTSSTPQQVVTVAGTSLTATLSGLAAGTYSFTVRAMNAIGTGPYSARSNSVLVASAPGVPRNLAVTPADGTILARWDPPITDGGSPITSYTVQLLVGSTVVRSATVTGTSATFAALTNNVTYTITVVASNVMGSSGPVLATATPFNSPPILTVPGTQAVQYSDPLSFTVSARGPEPADHLTFTATGLPAGLTFVDQGNGTGVVNGTVTSAPGSYTVSITVTDAHNAPVTQAVTINVGKESLLITRHTSPASVSVKGANDTLKSITLQAGVREVTDASPGDLTKAGPLTYTLKPIGTGKTYTKMVSNLTVLPGGEVQLKVTFKNVEQNVYRVSVGTKSAYYEGSDYTLLTVYSAAVHRSVSAEGDISVNNNPTYFRVSVVQPATGKTQSAFRYIEQRSTGPVTLTGKLVGGMVVKGKYAYMQLKGSMNGVGGHRFGVSIYDKGNPARIDQVGLEVFGPTGTPVLGCSFAMTSLLGGDAVISP